MAYRFVDEAPNETKQEQKPQPTQEGQRYRFVDEESPRTVNKKKEDPFSISEVTPEEYEKMSLLEKQYYSQDLANKLRIKSSKPYAKNLISGLTLGASENIEALRPEEGEDAAAGGFGKVVGELAPITGISKLVGHGLKAATKAIEHGPKILQYLNRFAHGFATGGLYESGKQGVKAASGEETDLSQIPLTASLFGAGESLIQAFGDVGRKFMQMSPKHQAQILEQRIIPSDLPKSQYETAEEMINLIKERQNNNFIGGLPGGGPQPTSANAPGLRNRVTPQGEDLGLRPVPQRIHPETNENLIDDVGNIFSRNRFYNTTQGGHAFRDEIRAIDQNVYRGVNQLYARSRDLNSQISEIHPNLAGTLEDRIAELRAIPEPSNVQKRLLRASENILERLAVVGEDGEISGYLPINNQVLIDQVQSLRQIIDYDFSHGDIKNIFRPLINEVQDAALNAARSSGAPEAAEAINEARNAYRMWVEAFDNDYVRPFRDSSNQDYSKLFKSSLDFDEHNMLRRILNTTPRGQELLQGSTREIVEKNLGKFFENPKTANLKDFNAAVRELESVITPEQAQEVRDLFREAVNRPNAPRAIYRATHQVRQPTSQESIAAKYLDKKPEDIQKMMNSRSGIKELRKDFSGTEQKKELFETLSKQKMRSIMREGNIEKDFTGDDLYKFLNKESNYEIFSELLGETETEALRKSAKEIGKAQVKSEIRKEKISNVTNKFVSFKILKNLLDIL